jgi:hypothetical protein
VADDLAKIVENPFAISADQVYSRDQPQYLGRRAILSLTDTASAAQYGVQAARLSRAGDNGDNRTFIAPDVAGLTSGVDAMATDEEPDVLEPDPAATTEGAYPLTSLTYAAIRPLALDTQARTDYAAFIDYAAGPGQVPGLELGQLPVGYAPLPANLRAQATAAAETVRTLQPTPDDPPPPDNPVPNNDFPPTPTDTPTTTPAPGPATPGPPEPTAEVLVTPIVAFATSGIALPALAALTILAALGAVEITKRNRRGAAPKEGGA